MSDSEEDRSRRPREAARSPAAAGVWQVTGYAAGRAVLRSTDTVQAGLGVETVEKLPPSIRRPVLYRDGEEHREHRRQTARFFTPRRVDEHYRGLMERVADEQLAEPAAAHGEADLAKLSFRMAIEVVSAVIGLTDSRPGLDRRLDAFFPEKFGKPGFTSLNGIRWVFKQNLQFLGIYLADVRPGGPRAAQAAARRPHLAPDRRGLPRRGDPGRVPDVRGGRAWSRPGSSSTSWRGICSPTRRCGSGTPAATNRTGSRCCTSCCDWSPWSATSSGARPRQLAAGDGEIPAGALVDVDVSAATWSRGVRGAGARVRRRAAQVPGRLRGDPGGRHLPEQAVRAAGPADGQPPRVAMKPDISSYELRGLHRQRAAARRRRGRQGHRGRVLDHPLDHDAGAAAGGRGEAQVRRDEVAAGARCRPRPAGPGSPAPTGSGGRRARRSSRRARSPAG